MDDERQDRHSSSVSVLLSVNRQRQRGSRSSSSGRSCGRPWRQTRKSLVRWDCEDLWGQEMARRQNGDLGGAESALDLNPFHDID